MTEICAKWLADKDAYCIYVILAAHDQQFDDDKCQNRLYELCCVQMNMCPFYVKQKFVWTCIGAAILMIAAMIVAICYFCWLRKQKKNEEDEK
ncbi:unnamed protein product [Caenorhabditis sp. 36 PRJEB53466]|nr:unnamed protein product [Caenorhabditis sp. 36 PRJEB53466]